MTAPKKSEKSFDITADMKNLLKLCADIKQSLKVIKPKLVAARELHKTITDKIDKINCDLDDIDTFLLNSICECCDK